MNKVVLMLLDNPLVNDRRVLREAQTLTDSNFEVIILCVGNKDLPKSENISGIKVHRIFDLSIFDPKKLFHHKKLAKRIARDYVFDIIHAHDQTMLNLGVQVKKITNSPLIYDSHELFHSWPLNLSNFNSKFVYLKSLVVRKRFIAREKRNAKHIDFLVTVNQSIVENLCDYLNIKPAKTLVLRNTPEFSGNFTASNILREKFNLPASEKILVFIGANIYLNSLNVEQVFEEFYNQPGVSIVVIATFNQNCQLVKDYVKSKSLTNVYFHDKIKPGEINQYLASADVGLVPTWNKKDLSYWFALDNKLFEYIQAGIPVLATAQPEYKLIVEDYECGICVNPDEKNAYINGFNAIFSSIDHYRENAKKAAKLLAWETEKDKLVSFYQDVVLK